MISYLFKRHLHLKGINSLSDNQLFLFLRANLANLLRTALRFGSLISTQRIPVNTACEHERERSTKTSPIDHNLATTQFRDIRVPIVTPPSIVDVRLKAADNGESVTIPYAISGYVLQERGHTSKK